MDKKKYSSTKICAICGATYIVTNPHAHPQSCPECRTYIQTGKRNEPARTPRRKSRITEILAEANMLGVSYGVYVGFRRAGIPIMPQKKYQNLSWQSWKSKLYACVCRKDRSVIHAR